MFFMKSIYVLVLTTMIRTFGAHAQDVLIHENMSRTFEDLREIKGAYHQVYHLKLTGKNLTTVPKEVREMSNLSTLILADNRISDLGNALDKTSQLQVLDVDNNDLREIPVAALKNCRQLVELNIRGNNIEKLPPDVGQLKYLKMLDLGDNKLQALDTTIYLPYLAKFRADNNRLTIIPAFLMRCKALDYLNLYGNQIMDLSSIGQLNRLRTLNIGDNPLRDLKPMANLGQLEHLTLDWIDLDSTMQDGLENLRKLRILSVENCGLDKLPEWIAARKNLEELSLIGNNLSEVPKALFQMKRLKKLWLGKNPLPQDQVDELRKRLSRCEINF